jgi:hypothetical protein
VVTPQPICYPTFWEVLPCYSGAILICRHYSQTTSTPAPLFTTPPTQPKYITPHHPPTQHRSPAQHRSPQHRQHTPTHNTVNSTVCSREAVVSSLISAPSAGSPITSTSSTSSATAKFVHPPPLLIVSGTVGVILTFLFLPLCHFSPPILLAGGTVDLRLWFPLLLFPLLLSPWFLPLAYLPLHVTPHSL